MMLPSKKHSLTKRELVFLLLICSISAALYLFKLSENMIFIGDQAWFYLSSRDLLLGQALPLVGITSSHTWLHQGPLWTYILAIALWLGNFNPLAGGYLSVAIQLITIVTLYIFGKRMLGERVATTAVIFYALSPLVLMHTRMPYHTTPIPLFTLLYFFSLFQWLKGKKSYLSLSLLFLAILYNFELATVVLAAPLIIISIYGLIKKKNWIHNLTYRDILRSVLFAIIPMLPILLYDMTHGFKQTVVYAGWLVVNALRVIGLSFYSVHPVAQSINIYQFTYELLQKLVFLPSAPVALILLGSSLIYALYVLYKQYYKKAVNVGLLLCTLWFVLTIIFYFANKTPSEAYLPMLFPVVIILLSYFLNGIIKSRLLYVVISIVVVLNIGMLFKANYFMANFGVLTLESRREAVQKIITSSSKDEPYRILGKGSGSQFESFTMPYEYLAWYMGRPVSKTKSGQVFILEEKGATVEVTKKL